MNKEQLKANLEALNNLYAKENELKEAIKEQEQIFKDYMTENNLEHLDLGNGVIHWTQVISKVFDLKKFRADFGEVAEYMKERVSRRFQVA